MTTPNELPPPVAGDETRDWLTALRWIAGTKTANSDEEGVVVRLGDLKAALAALRPAPETAAPVAWDVVSHAGNRVSGPHGKQEAAEHHALRLRSEIGTATVRPLYAAPSAPASAPKEASENIARNYVPERESLTCGDEVAVLTFRDRVALIEAGRHLRPFDDLDVLRALCGEAAACVDEVDNDAARELAVRLRQAWNGQDPVGDSSAPASGEQRADVTDTQRLDAIECGEIEVESMGTTVSYQNVIHTPSGRMTTTAGGGRNLRQAIDAALRARQGENNG